MRFSYDVFQYALIFLLCEHGQCLYISVSRYCGDFDFSVWSQNGSCRANAGRVLDPTIFVFCLFLFLLSFFCL